MDVEKLRPLNNTLRKATVGKEIFMVKITKVYTRTGDSGKTNVAKHGRMTKKSLLVDILGLFDEFNSFLGWSVLKLTEDSLIDNRLFLIKVQNNLFDLGSYLCAKKENTHLATFMQETVVEIERRIDDINTHLPSLNSFILPGGCEVSARLHIARTVCRRLERKLTALKTKQDISFVLIYINRLSDWLFVLARFCLSSNGKKEKIWLPFEAFSNSSKDQ